MVSAVLSSGGATRSATARVRGVTCVGDFVAVCTVGGSQEWRKMTTIIRAGSAADPPDARSYGGFEDLCRAQRRGRDFEIHVRRRRASDIAVIAPHAGGTEDGTSEIARAIADDDLNLYLFEGLRPAHNYHALHLTSHLFDEPQCLELIAGCATVVAVHGCAGTEARVYLGGRDHALRDHLAAALRGGGVPAQTSGHRYPAARPDNVCNRGATGRGVQIELTHPLRRGEDAMHVATRIRAALGAPPPCHYTTDQLLCATSA
jgi:phage replication-related protein YjqB (UPF0714/DUF867 family)